MDTPTIMRAARAVSANTLALDLLDEKRADLRRALRAYDLAGPLTETRRRALGDVLTLARQLTEE